MTDNKPTEKPSSEEMDSTSRRDFMKVAGVGALGLAYASPIVETLRGGTRLTNYDPPRGGGGSSSSHPGGSSSKPGDGGSSSSWPGQSSSENSGQTI